MNSASIRPATRQDVAGIARVHVQAWHESYRGMVPDTAIDRYTLDMRRAGWEEWLAREGWVTYVADLDGEIAGFACAYPDDTEPGYDTYLNTLYVLRSAQRRGIARELLRALAAPLIERGSTAMWWLTLRENPACAFYERIGAALIREQPAPPGLGAGTMDAVFGLADLRVLL